MLTNYLKLSLRLLARNPFFTVINVAGLSVGFAVFFILWPFVQSELKSDQFIPEHDKIVRLISDFKWTDNGGASWGHLNISTSDSHIANEMRDQPGIISSTRFAPQEFFWTNSSPAPSSDLVVAVEVNGQTIKQRIENAICADKNFFEFFGLPLLWGNPQKALETTDAIVLSEKASVALLGPGNSIGKLIKVNNKLFQVTAVFKDIPAHSHFKFDYVFSNQGLLSYWNTTENLWTYHYFKSDNPDQVAAIVNRQKELLIGSYLNRNQHIKIDFFTQPLKEVAFSLNYNNDYFKPKSKFILKMLASVSLVILLMAWMNYVNLTISRTKYRFKEIAARKVSGAIASDLFIQFVCQSAVINLLAVSVGLTLVQLFRLPFESLFSIKVVPINELNFTTILFFFVVFVLGVIGTSAYPALVMVRQTTRQLLTGSLPANKRITTTVFTTIQYVAALTLISWIFVMNSQLEFILNKSLGMDHENMMVIEAPVIGLEENGLQKMQSFVMELVSKSPIAKHCLSGRTYGELPYNEEVRRTGSSVFYGFDSHGGVDENFIPAYGLKVIAGRNFVKDEKKMSIILSRMATERLGFKTPEEAIGSMIEMKAPAWEPVEIIGVIEDYRVHPFLMGEGNSEAISGRGQCLTYLNSVWTMAIPNRLSIKVTGENLVETLASVEGIYHRFFPGNIFHASFLDEKINSQYNDQKTTRNQLSLFTMLAIVVACLGLLGMISNQVADRMKEISIRRILGAGTRSITRILLHNTFRQIAVAVILGLPIARRLSQDYLNNFTDQIQLQWWHFITPVAILLFIMLFTISFVLWKAAKNNPVEALKYE